MSIPKYEANLKLLTIFFERYVSFFTHIRILLDMENLYFLINLNIYKNNFLVVIFLKRNNLHVTGGPSYYAETSRFTQDQHSMRLNAQNKWKCEQKGNERRRDNFTADQVNILKEVFIKTQYPDYFTRVRIANQINEEEKRVQVKMISRYHVDCINE